MKIQPTLSEVQPSTMQQPGTEANTNDNAAAGDFFAMLAGLFLPQMLQKQPLPTAQMPVEGANAKTVEDTPATETSAAELGFNLMPNWSIPLPVAVQQVAEATQELPVTQPLSTAKVVKSNVPVAAPLELTKMAPQDKKQQSTPIDVPTYTDFDVPHTDDEPTSFAEAMPDAATLVLPEIKLETTSEGKVPDNINTTLTDISQVLNQAAPTVQLSTPTNPLTLNAKAEALQPSANTPVQIEFSPVSLAAVGKEVYNAQIKIHPPELGNVIAKLKLDKDGANLTILAENNVVKGIVEANLPALREHFQRADIPLNQIQVQVDAKPNNPPLFADENREQRPQNQSNQYKSGQEEVENQNKDHNTTKTKLNSLVDTYA